MEPENADSWVTDSGEDLEDSDDHKLVQFAQAIHKGQPVIIAVRGQFKGYQDQEIEVLFQRDHQGAPPSDILEPWVTAMQGIVALSTVYCSEGLPNSCFWAQPGTPREHMDISLAKSGKGVMITYTPKGFSGMAFTALPASYVVRLAGGWEISFGAQQSPSDAELTQ
jgi:hypothetical protein